MLISELCCLFIHIQAILINIYLHSLVGLTNAEFTNSFFNHIINQSQVHWNDKIKSFLWSFTIEYFFVYYIEYSCALLWEKFSGRSTEIFKGEVHLEKRAESCPCENTDGAMWHEQAQEHISWLVADASIVRQKIKWSPFPFLCVVKQFLGSVVSDSGCFFIIHLCRHSGKVWVPIYSSMLRYQAWNSKFRNLSRQGSHSCLYLILLMSHSACFALFMPQFITHVFALI